MVIFINCPSEWKPNKTGKGVEDYGIYAAIVWLDMRPCASERLWSQKDPDSPQSQQAVDYAQCHVAKNR